jgi:hypothetical protein
MRRAGNETPLAACRLVPASSVRPERRREWFDFSDKIAPKESLMPPTFQAFPYTRRDFLKHVSAFTVSGGIFLQTLNAQDAQFVVAQTAFGKIRGVDNDGIKVFKGIPYGASTAGANRFMAPAEPAKWTGVRDALQYGHSAPQSDPAAPPRAPGALTISGQNLPAEGEDCLVLNIWTPSVESGGGGRKRPVMFWCHGGGFASGSGSSPDNDGTNLARRGDVVVVSINHRLNVLGFANLSEFSRDFAASGDAGMLDIVQALKWVRANISAIWRRSKHGDDLRPVRRRAQGGDVARDALGQGAFSSRDCRKRRGVTLVDRDVAVQTRSCSSPS